MNTIIISAVNLTEGGTLSILKSFLQALSMSELSNIYRVIALVNNKDRVAKSKKKVAIPYLL